MYNISQINSVVNILKKNKTNYWTGNECKKFEKEFSKYHNVKYSVAVSNGSVALELAIRALNLKKGSEIIVTPRSFIISASAVMNLGFRPIFADVDSNGNLSSNEILKVLSKKTKAVILVHLNGISCDLDPIVKLVKKKKIYLIEDCSQAHGARYKKKPVGSFGDIATWSFCQDKIISTGGEGGMISTNRKIFWEKCWSYKDHGKNYFKVFKKKHKTGFKWLHDYYGSNYRMTEIQATIGRHQLKNLDNQIKHRNNIAKIYSNELKDFIGKDKLLRQAKSKTKTCRNAFYRINYFLNENKNNQLKILNDINKKKIKCLVGPCPEIYREIIFKKILKKPFKRLPNAKRLGETSIVFPISLNKSIIKIKHEVQIIKKILSKHI